MRVIFLTAICSASSISNANSAGSASSASPNGPWFWTAKKDGKTLNMLGTFHMGVAMEELQCFEQISGSLYNSDLVFTESDLNPYSEYQKNMAEESLKALSDSEGESFQNLSEQSQQFLKEKVSYFGLDVEKMSYTSMLGILNAVCHSDHIDFIHEQFPSFNFSSLMDKQVQETAQFRDITQAYLDDMKHLVEIARSNAEKHAASTEEVEKYIQNYETECSREKIKEKFEHIISSLKEMRNNYKSGREISLTAMVEMYKKKGASESEIEIFKNNYNQNLLKARNEIWLEKLLSAHNSYNNIFVAAGLVHFTDNFNILDKLKEEGFSVQRLNPDCHLD